MSINSRGGRERANRTGLSGCGRRLGVSADLEGGLISPTNHTHISNSHATRDHESILAGQLLSLKTCISACHSIKRIPGKVPWN